MLTVFQIKMHGGIFKALLILLIILLFLLACSKKEDFSGPFEEITLSDRPAGIRFEKIIEKEIEGALIHRPILDRNSDPEHIFMMVSLASKGKEIRRYNSDLELQASFSLRHGQGPGEAMNAIFMGGDSEELLVFDTMLRRLTFFDRDFKVNRTVLIKSSQIDYNMFTNFFFSAQDNLFIVNGEESHYNKLNKMFSKNGAISVGKIEGDHLKLRSVSRARKHKDGHFTEKGISVETGVPLIVEFHNDHLFMLNTRDYELVKTDLLDRVTRAVKVPFKEKSFSVAERREWVDEGYTNVSKTNRGKIDLPGDLWPAAFILKLGEGLVVGRRESFDVREKKEFCQADYFDLELNHIG